jgi:hypothetical protein
LILYGYTGNPSIKMGNVNEKATLFSGNKGKVRVMDYQCPKTHNGRSRGAPLKFE